MLSRTVTKLAVNSEALETFVSAHGGTLGAGLAARAAALGLEVEPPPGTALQLLLVEALRQGRLQMAEADQEHSAEKAGDGPTRVERDSAATVLRLRLLQVRNLVLGVYGPEQAASLLGFSGKVGRYPPLLQRQAQAVIERLSSEPPVPPSVAAKAVVPDTESLAEMLREPLAQLKLALANLHEERRRAEITQAEKDARLQDQDLLARCTVGVVYSLSRLVGRPDLAERARALIRRPRSPRPQLPGPRPGGGPPGPELPGPGIPLPEIPLPGIPLPEPEPTEEEPPKAGVSGKGGAR